MIARRRARLTLAAVVLVAGSACQRATPPSAPRTLEFGSRQVQVIVPIGWEALDQGRQKRFRKGEFEIVLQYLGQPTPPPRDMDELVDRGIAATDQGQGREVKSRRPVTIDGRKAIDVETWSRLDHTNPQRFFFVKDDDDLLALYTVRMAFEDTLAAFDAIRDSLHFVSARR